MNSYIAILLTLLSLGGIILFSSTGVRRGCLSSEQSRKMVHVGMGLICMTFPWLYQSAVAVQLLAIFAVLSLLALRFTRLRSTIGSALFSVKRLSVGELLFPIAVAWLFTLSFENPLLYVISLLLLTLADTAGALAGSKYGKRIYQTVSASKSIEGSLAFAATSFICTSLPLYHFTELPIFFILLLSLNMALFMMAVEGASGHGFDNIFIPIGSFLLLDYYTELTQQQMLFRSILLLFLLALLTSTKHRHSFDGGAFLGSMLLGFALCTLGGTACLLSAFVLFVRHLYTQSRSKSKDAAKQSIVIVAAIALPCLSWLTLARLNIISMELGQVITIVTLSLITAMLHTCTQRTQRSTIQRHPSLLSTFIWLILSVSPALLLSPPWIVFFPHLIIGTLLAWWYFHLVKLDKSDYLNDVKLAILSFCGSAIITLPFLS